MAKICQVVFNIECAAKRRSATNVHKSRSACTRSSGLRLVALVFSAGKPEASIGDALSVPLAVGLRRDGSYVGDQGLTHLKIAALSSLIMLAGLAGCSSNAYQPKSADQSSDTEYRQNGGSYYAPPPRIGPVMTTVAAGRCIRSTMTKPRQSNCYEACAKHWPPVMADGYAQEYGGHVPDHRADGQQQWPMTAIRSIPTQRRMQGDVKGDDVGSVWHVVR